MNMDPESLTKRHIDFLHDIFLGKLYLANYTIEGNAILAQSKYIEFIETQENMRKDYSKVSLDDGSSYPFDEFILKRVFNYEERLKQDKAKHCEYNSRCISSYLELVKTPAMLNDMPIQWLDVIYKRFMKEYGYTPEDMETFFPFKKMPLQTSLLVNNLLSFHPVFNWMSSITSLDYWLTKNSE